jgi:hypothetical protein
MMVVKPVVSVVVDEGHGEERKKGENSLQRKKMGEAWFLDNFELDFIHAQAMKSNPIYRGWKRGKFWPLIWLGRISTVGLK